MKHPRYLFPSDYMADPSANVFNDRLYIFPSHDRDSGEAFDDDGGHFQMRDYHVLSLDDVANGEITDHGVILDVDQVEWAEKQMWDNDVIEKNGKEAVTHFKVLERFDRYTYMEFALETGRTHQIRVHMASIGHPLLGDVLYSTGKSPYKLQGQSLHAMTIGFVHPKTKEYHEVSAPLPEYFEKILRDLRH